MNSRLIFTTQIHLLSLTDTGTKTQRHIPKQTLSVLKCFSSLKQIDFLLLYHLPFFKGGKGQRIVSCCLQIFATDTPKSEQEQQLMPGFGFNAFIQLGLRKITSSTCKDFTEFWLNSVCSGIPSRDMLLKTITGVPPFSCLSAYTGELLSWTHPPCHRRTFRVKAFQLWSQNAKNYFKIALRKSRNGTLGVYTWNTLKPGTS